MGARRNLFAVAVFFEAGLGVLGLGAAAAFGVLPVAHLRPTFAQVATGLAATLPMLVGVAALSALSLPSLEAIRRELEKLLPRIFPDNSPARVLVAAAAAGVGEELLFRGFLQNALAAFLGPAGGLLGASLVFGAVHALTVTYAVLATVLGLWLGWLYLASGSLVAPVVAHAVYDAIAIVWLLRTLPARPDTVEATVP